MTMQSLFTNLNFKSEKELIQHFHKLFEENKAIIDIQDVTTIEHFLTSLVDTEVGLSCYFDMLDEKSNKFVSKMVKDVIYTTDFDDSIDQKLIPLVNKYDYSKYSKDIVNVRLLVRKCDKKMTSYENHLEYDDTLYSLMVNGEDERLIISCISTFKDTGYEINPFTKDELQKILDYNDDRLCNFIAISCFTGLRTGEMLGLRWCDVDLNNMTISVKQQFTRCFLQTPKTKKSMSTIELPIEALPFFERQRYKTGLREYVFYSPKNKEPWKSSYYINTLFKEMLRKLDIPERTIYQTRHTFASIRLTMGEKLEWVSYMMRHENTSITLKKYFKYIKELDVKRVDLNFDLTQKRHTC